MNDTNNTLMQMLDFSFDDLAANRNGKLSEMQHYDLRVKRRRSILVGVGLMFVGVFIASLFIFMGTRNDGSTIATIVGIGLTICTTALLGIYVRHWLRLSADISDKTVQITTGTLERVIKPVNRRVMTHIIRVDDVEVVVSKEAFDVFAHKLQHTIYTTKHTKQLLSAELVE